MKKKSIFSNVMLLKLKLLILLGIYSFNIFGQQSADVCPYVGGSTLCQLYGQSPVQINITTPTSTNTWLVPNWNNKTVFINAVLTVNSLFTVENCIIKLGASGKIVLTGGGNFHCVGTKFFSCAPTGWLGIRAEGGNTSFTQNTIEDADVAITIASNLASLIITNNTFNRNRIDILVPGHVAANAVIAGNIFDATSPNYLNSRPEAGIMANNSFITVGLPQPTSNLDRNIIKNHQRGASGSVATMNFRFTTFECNNQFGIFTENGSIDVRGSQNYRNLFLRNRIDVQSSGANLYFADSDFQNCFGNNINSFSNFSAQRITLENLNNFLIDNNPQGSEDKIGINLERSRGGASGQLNNRILINTFTIEEFTPEHSRSAIKVIGGPGTPDIMRIWGNFVNVQPGGSSPGISNASPMFNIEVGAANNFSVWFNNVSSTNFDLPNYGRRWGFYIHDRVSPSAGHTLIENHTFGAQSNYDHGMCAFHFESSGPWLICDNTTDYTLRGFHLNGACGNSKLISNTFGHHKRSQFPGTTETTSALMVEAGATIGAQLCRHNIWELQSYGPDAGAWHKGILGISDNRFDINPNIAEEEPNPIFANDDWFFPTCTQGPPSGHPCSGQEIDPEYIDDYENTIIGANQIFNPPSSVEQWEERRKVLAIAKAECF